MEKNKWIGIIVLFLIVILIAYFIGRDSSNPTIKSSVTTDLPNCETVAEASREAWSTSSLQPSLDDIISSGHFNTKLNTCVVEIDEANCLSGPICSLTRSVFVPGPQDGGAPNSTEKLLASCLLPISGAGLKSNESESCSDETTWTPISRTQFEQLENQYMSE